MQIVNDFCYKRNFFIRDLSRPKIIFNKCEQLEFDTFNSFIENYLSKDYMIAETPTIKRLIIPIEEVNQISQLEGLINSTPTFLFYLKNITKDIILEISTITLKNFGIFLDYEKIPLFKDILKNLSEEDRKRVAEKLFITHGAFRFILSKDTLNDFLDNIMESFLVFPFFNFCDLIVQYHTFEDLQLKDLHQLIYTFKLLFKNIIRETYSREVNWTYFNSSLSPIEYTFTFMKRTGYELYIKDNRIEIALENSFLPGYDCTLLTQDGNYVDQELLDRFLGMISLGYDHQYFISKYENYLCNENLTSLPYLNRILCNIIDKGDI